MPARKHFQTLQYCGPARLGKFQGPETIRTPAIVFNQVASLQSILDASENGSWGLSRLMQPFPQIRSPGTFVPGHFYQFTTLAEELQYLKTAVTTPHEFQTHFLHAHPFPFIDLTSEALEDTYSRLRGELIELHDIFDFVKEPNIVSWFPLFARSSGSQWEHLLDYYMENRTKFGGIQIHGAGTQEFNFRYTLRLFQKILDRLLPNTPILLTGPVFPHEYASYIYLGVDFFDISGILLASHRDLYLTPSGAYPSHQVSCLPCNCPVCLDQVQKSQDPPYDFPFTSLLAHNIHIALYKLREIQFQLRRETFRDYLEAEIHWDANRAAFLRWADTRHANGFQRFFPRVTAHPVVSIGPESFHRPDFEHYRERVLENFSFPSSTGLILLLPCSAHKPYSTSRSHRKFSRVLQKTLGKARKFVQEIILTSPLGCVPRQLENLYPANAYDIPVTGDWDSSEINITASMLASLLQSVDPATPIIAHVDGGYRKAAEIAARQTSRVISFTPCEGAESSRENLVLLGDALGEVRSQIEGSPREPGPGSRESWIKCIGDYQFGLGAGNALLETGARVITRGPRRWLETRGPRGKQTLAKFENFTDFLQPTLQGGACLKSHTRLTVTFAGERLSGSSLFSQGVASANPEIRPGDYVLVLDQSGDAVVGIGKAIEPGFRMFAEGEGPVLELIVKEKRRKH